MSGVRMAPVKRHPIAYNRQRFKNIAANFLDIACSAGDVEAARRRLFNHVCCLQFNTYRNLANLRKGSIIRIRDCARVLRTMLEKRSEALTSFSVTQAIFDLARERPRPDLEPGFYADLMHIIMGVEGRVTGTPPGELRVPVQFSGRRAARKRSDDLDRLWDRVEQRMASYAHGLQDETIERRKRRREAILSVLGGSEDDWSDWRWQRNHVVRDADVLSRLVSLTDEEYREIKTAQEARLPFGVTPYYLSLFDREPSERDRAVRAQVLPPASYVEAVREGRAAGRCGFDFMLEHDTSPIELITRRYPGIVIFKPYNTCPQVCVYCQRNWEISDVLAENALAPQDKIEQALHWIREHPAIREVLITGGDPLTVDDDLVQSFLAGVADIPSVERIRIGTRTIVTMPMRITDRLVHILTNHRILGRRQVAVVTHVEHPYEVTPEMAAAVQRLRHAGIPVYNQLVFTFYVSRRLEAALLRRLIYQIGIDPYYTFCTKGKEETDAYRVPIARLLQEAKEEARLLPGLERTDEPVYNVPGLGKNYIRAVQHRDLLAIRPNGARVYEFHPWEKNIVTQQTYVGDDVPILAYLQRLREIGEKPADYETIWYYF